MAALLDDGEDTDDWEPEEPEITGLNMTVGDLPDTSYPLDVMMLHSGEWWLRQQLDDRPMILESRRLPATEFGEEAVWRLIALEWPGARETSVEPFRELSEKLTYPVHKAKFLTGGNEDTEQFVAALVFTGEWNFWFVLEADIDAESKSGTIKREMEALLLGIGEVNPEDGSFLPGPGLPVYNSGAEALDGMSIMDALIRIKKHTSPESNPQAGENSPYPGEGRLAYRYDGIGEYDEVDGAASGLPGPSLLFSFGGDARGKFTAERHFAVAPSGAVYEMNPADGPEYRLVKEPLPMWAGKFRGGDLLLEIGMVREGPTGRYVGGLFSGEGKEPMRVQAAVDGRKAVVDDSEFFLSGDDSTVTVVVEESGDVLVLERVVGDGEGAATGVTFINNLGFDIEAVYAQRSGETPQKIAGTVAGGETAEITISIPEKSCWLYVKPADDENEEAPPLQFFSASYLDEVERMELALSDIRKVPVLLTVEDGEKDAAFAGLPFMNLLHRLESESGLDAGKYADLMTPLAADGWEEYPNALVSGGLSWSLLAPGPVFREDEDGEKRLSEIAFSAAGSRGELTEFLKEFEDYEMTAREQSDKRVSLESSRSFYDIRFDTETQVMELRYTRKTDDEQADNEHDDNEPNG
jgi:hypothetical protein